jgi:hypothetical protein
MQTFSGQLFGEFVFFLMHDIIMKIVLHTKHTYQINGEVSGLTDVSWYNIPKREKYQTFGLKNTERPKIYQIAVQYNQHFPFHGPPKFTKIWTLVFG